MRPKRIRADLKTEKGDLEECVCVHVCMRRPILFKYVCEVSKSGSSLYLWGPTALWGPN